MVGLTVASAIDDRRGRVVGDRRGAHHRAVEVVGDDQVVAASAPTPSTGRRRSRRRPRRAGRRRGSSRRRPSRGSGCALGVGAVDRQRVELVRRTEPGGAVGRTAQRRSGRPRPARWRAARAAAGAASYDAVTAVRPPAVAAGRRRSARRCRAGLRRRCRARRSPSAGPGRHAPRGRRRRRARGRACCAPTAASLGTTQVWVPACPRTRPGGRSAASRGVSDAVVCPPRVVAEHDPVAGHQGDQVGALGAVGTRRGRDGGGGGGWRCRRRWPARRRAPRSRRAAVSTDRAPVGHAAAGSRSWSAFPRETCCRHSTRCRAPDVVARHGNVAPVSRATRPTDAARRSSVRACSTPWSPVC